LAGIERWCGSGCCQYDVSTVRKRKAGQRTERAQVKGKEGVRRKKICLKR
jgi:hypothetical protein